MADASPNPTAPPEEPNTEAVPPPAARALVALAPTGSCVAIGVDCPADAKAEELAGLAELTLEANSPFPMEQLSWGYLVVGERMRIFALPRNRFPAELVAALPEARHVIPAAVALLLNPDFQRTPLLLAHGGHLSFIPNDPNLPLRHRPIGDDSPETLQATAPHLGIPDLTAPSAPPVLRNVQALAGTQQTTFRADKDHPTEGTTEVVQWAVPTDRLWSADLRGAPEVRRIQRQLMLESWTYRGLQAWGFLAGLTLVLLLVWGGLSLYGRSTAAEVAELTPRFEAVNDNLQIINRLQSTNADPFDPFIILERINQFRPVRQIWLSFFDVASDNLVTVRGSVGEINTVNAYVDRLIESGYFESVEEMDTRVRDERYEFTLRLRYLPPAEETSPPNAS